MAHHHRHDGPSHYGDGLNGQPHSFQGAAQLMGEAGYSGVDNGEQLYEEQNTLRSHDDTHTFDSSVPDLLQLNNLCANASAPRGQTEEARLEAEESWEPVRGWLRTHSKNVVRQAAEQRGESSMTALHFACRNKPPMDVINEFLTLAVETVQWPDSFGWLPIHYACAYGADTVVIKGLADAFPESKTTVDRNGRTPLHFALGNQNTDRLVSPDVVAILSSTGAASYADTNGMLPLHYACAYGALEESLFVLTAAYNVAISVQDLSGRTPLHFALSNAGRKASPGAVRHLLKLDNKLANSNGGPLPLRVLAEFSRNLKKGENTQESVQKCLELLLLADPEPTADFFTALQSLPDWLSEPAVVMPSVQVLLNEKISQRFPTAVLLLDFYFLAMIIISYSFNVNESVKLRFNDIVNDDAISASTLSPLYIGAGYFLLREIIQIISLLSLKSFHIWVYDPSNWLNVVFIFLVLFWTILMNTGNGNDTRFRTGAALSVTILWLKVLAFLRNMLIDFAVFAGGVFYVLQRLFAFLVSLGVVLVGYAQMFVTVFQQTDYCNVDAIEVQPKSPTAIACNTVNDFPFCKFWDAFLYVYSMLVGEVNEQDFEDSNFATFLYITFMFLVVILLANVLIAIVTDSYKVIQDQRAAIVFWTNRLNFVAEMDAIASGPWKKHVRRIFAADEHEEVHHMETVFGKEFWKRLIDLFEDEIDSNVSTAEFWAYNSLRWFTAVGIIPMWIVLGILSAGWLWPPQVREYIFTSTVSKHSSETEREAELRRTQVDLLKKEVESLKEAMAHELKIDRTQIIQMKSGIADRRTEIAAEMKHIKRVMTMLFEQQ